MREEIGDLWEAQKRGYIAIPTNGVVDSQGRAVMGKGLALDAKARYPWIPERLGLIIARTGNHVYYFPDAKLFTFPTKGDWKDPSNLGLIRQSAVELKALAWNLTVFLPRVGCGEGRLNWMEVRKTLEPILSSDNYVVISKE